MNLYFIAICFVTMGVLRVFGKIIDEKGKQPKMPSSTDNKTSEEVPTKTAAPENAEAACQRLPENLPHKDLTQEQPPNEKEHKTMNANCSLQIANAIDAYIKGNDLVSEFDRELGYAHIEWTAAPVCLRIPCSRWSTFSFHF